MLTQNFGPADWGNLVTNIFGAYEFPKDGVYAFGVDFEVLSGSPTALSISIDLDGAGPDVDIAFASLVGANKTRNTIPRLVFQAETVGRFMQATVSSNDPSAVVKVSLAVVRLKEES